MWNIREEASGAGQQGRQIATGNPGNSGSPVAPARLAPNRPATNPEIESNRSSLPIFHKKIHVSRVTKTWHLMPHDGPAIERLADALRISPIAAQLLLNRGIHDPAEARRFIESPLVGLHSPQLLPGVNKAVDLLIQAIETKAPICVYGDYDADGITGTALLWQLLNLLHLPVRFFTPNRLGDGYGLKVEAIQQLASEGVKVVVSVDCGVTATDVAVEARRLGITLIITDHHEPKEELPAADALVHPRIPEGAYPFGGLSGSGVAFKLAWALCTRLSGSDKVEPRFREYLLDAVALASLGLIADVVPLQDENRILVKHGLNRIVTKPTVGLRALLESAGLTLGKTLRAEDVAFRMAPRLNAVGRLGCARLVVDLLTTNDVNRAKELAAYLDNQNKERQALERKITQHAKSMLEGIDPQTLSAIVLAHPDWHPGVIGIVAGRLVEAYGRPTLMIASQAEASPGSGRSIPGFALHEALQACDSELVKHGGHAAAAGFQVYTDRIDRLRERFCAYAAAHYPAGVPAPRLMLDAEVPLSALTIGLVRELDRLEPYGAQNPRPRFLAGGLQIIGELKKVGGGERHLSFRVTQNRCKLKAIAFNMADRIDELLSASGKCCLAFTPRINVWNDNTSVDLEVIDFQAGPTANLV